MSNGSNGSKNGFCDGVSRRGFLKIGAFSMGATTLTLADILRAEAVSGAPRKHKAVINVFLGGGPPHQDLWDIKSEAPSEIRGEFQAIDTSVPGIRIGETLPKIAKLMHKCALIRSVVGANSGHDPIQCYSGYNGGSLAAIGGRPSIGAVVSKLKGSVVAAVPPFVGLANEMIFKGWQDPGRAGFLGPAHAAFKPDGQGMANMKLNSIPVERLRDRRSLLASFDTLRRDIDNSGAMEGMDIFGAQAIDVLTSSRLVDALDLSKEDPRVRERYGDGKPFNYQFDGAPTDNAQLLMARRLVEAGVRCVTLTYGRWDSHGDNFTLVRDHGAKLDQCLSALIEDLDQRRMLDDVAVIAWGEFGRTPRINPQAGRDHWPQVNSAFLVGGGIRGGQVIGSTNRLGEHAVDRPVHFQEVLATLYHTLGIDAASTTIVDPTGRPQYLLERGPVAELV